MECIKSWSRESNSSRRRVVVSGSRGGAPECVVVRDHVPCRRRSDATYPVLIPPTLRLSALPPHTLSLRFDCAELDVPDFLISSVHTAALHPTSRRAPVLLPFDRFEPGPLLRSRSIHPHRSSFSGQSVHFASPLLHHCFQHSPRCSLTASSPSKSSPCTSHVTCAAPCVCSTVLQPLPTIYLFTCPKATRRSLTALRRTLVFHLRCTHLIAACPFT